MRNIPLLVLFGLLHTGYLVQSQSVKDIRFTYNRIQNELSDYSSKTVPVFGMSTEGGETTGYYKNDTIQKVSTILFGETGKWFQECYFNNGDLVFVMETNHCYNAPIYFDKKLADKMGVTDVFDVEKTKITENRYYLKNDVVFKWLNDAGKPEDANPEDFKKKTEDVLSISKKLQELLVN